VKLPPDWSEFIGCLRAHRVRYLIVGAHALAAHGRPRATQDLDVWVAPTLANAQRVGAALRDFGFPALARAWRRFADATCVAQLGHPPLQIDVLTGITGVRFAAAWRGRVELEVDGGPIYFLGEDELRLNKASTGRAKDRLDLELLGPKRRSRAPRRPARRR
jgi:hypothetical protein